MNFQIEYRQEERSAAYDVDIENCIISVAADYYVFTSVG